MSTQTAVSSRRGVTDSIFVLVVAASAWLAALAGIRPLMLPDEGRYVGVAWEMIASGQWLVPKIAGMPYFHKPPLFYWITALGLDVFGVNQWAARLASILAGVATTVAVHAFVSRYRDRRTATLAALVMVTQPFFYGGAQFANLDMLVAGMISITILSGADALLRLERQQPCRAALARTYVLAALGVLAKGLIGIVLPFGVLFVWIVLRRSWRTLWTIAWPPGYALFALVALPWFFWMQHLYPGFFDYFVVYHHFQRFSSGGFNNQQPVWFFGAVLLLLTLPWSPWLCTMLGQKYRTNGMSDPLRSLMVVWLLLILCFFSLPQSKLVGYILPVLPAFSFLIADALLRSLDPGRRRAWRLVALTAVAAGTVCVAVIVGISLHGDVAAKRLAAGHRHDFGAGDQLAMIGEYRFDLPFYLESRRPAWVVLDWSDPRIPASDNWQKELFDAGKFDSAAAESALVSVSGFEERLCGYRSGSVWVWVGRKAVSSLPWLKDVAMLGKDGSQALWRLSPETIRTLPVCGGKPTGG